MLRQFSHMFWCFCICTVLSSCQPTKPQASASVNPCPNGTSFQDSFKLQICLECRTIAQVDSFELNAGRKQISLSEHEIASVFFQYSPREADSLLSGGHHPIFTNDLATIDFGASLFKAYFYASDVDSLPSQISLYAFTSSADSNYKLGQILLKLFHNEPTLAKRGIANSHNLNQPVSIPQFQAILKGIEKDLCNSQWWECPENPEIWSINPKYDPKNEGSWMFFSIDSVGAKHPLAPGLDQMWITYPGLRFDYFSRHPDKKGDLRYNRLAVLKMDWTGWPDLYRIAPLSSDRNHDTTHYQYNVQPTDWAIYLGISE